MATSDDIIDSFNFFDTWEDRYRYMIDLGKEIPPMPKKLLTQEQLVPGCQSQVWIDHQIQHNRLIFQVDSDALIVKGILAIIMAAYNNKTSQEILDFDIEGYFLKLDLIKHLSPTRGNGLKAIVGKIKQLANNFISQ